MRKLLALMLACVLVLGLAACGTPTAPAACGTPTAPAATEAETVTVSNIDEFLAALGSCRTIVLEPGHYYLYDAADYGTHSNNPSYSWEDEYDGTYELRLRNVQELTIVGSGMTQTFLETLSGAAAVFRLNDSTNVTIRDLTMGHVETPQVCGGEVIQVMDCAGIRLEGLGLYGCGTTGVSVARGQDITVSGCHIYECTVDGISLYECSGVNISNSVIHDINSGANTILDLNNCSDVTMDSCSVFDSSVDYLIYNFRPSKNIVVSNTTFRNNWIGRAAFDLGANVITVENCTFSGIDTDRWCETGSVCTGSEGKKLSEEDFDWMNRSGSTLAPDRTYQDITVSNIDEFLAALGPNRQIRLVPGTYNLCDASNYGWETDSRYYEWVETFDGYELKLNDVKGLTILGSGANQTFIETLPRSVAVLELSGCADITLRDMTMGHVEMAEYCEGPVLRVEDCFGIALEGLGLYGCGTEGVNAWHSQDLTVNNCHIYDCAVFGAYLFDCDNISITNCTIERIGMGGMSVLSVDNCSGVIVDNCTVSECAVNELIECWTLRGDFAIKNTTFRNNYAYCAIVSYQGEKITLDNCTFAGNTVDFWYEEGAASCAVDATGAPITVADFMAMNG